MADDFPLMHIYPQIMWHTDAAIVGNRKALKALRDAIDKVLETDEKGAMVPVMAADGEGYYTAVVRLDGNLSSAHWQEMAVPYTDDPAAEQRKDAKSYIDVLGVEKYKELYNAFATDSK